MGHQRLAKLPASKHLPEIINLLLTEDVSDEALAEPLAKACDEMLRRALRDPAFVESLWLLVRIPQAANATDFSEALLAIGIEVPSTPSVTDIAVGFDGAVETVQRNGGAEITDLGEIARQAGIASLSSLAQEQLPSLWDPTREDVRTTIATFAGPDKFGELAQRFFTNFVERIIHYFVDRGVPDLVGPSQIARSIGDLKTFDAAVHHHCREATTIMRAFAKDWLAKNVVHGGREISRQDAVGFGRYAADKIRKELTLRSKVREEV